MKTAESGNGLSDGILPSLSIRRILPNKARFVLSRFNQIGMATEMYNLSSRPNAKAPPAYSPSGLAGILSNRTFSSVALSFDSVNLTTLLKVLPDCCLSRYNKDIHND